MLVQAPARARGLAALAPVLAMALILAGCNVNGPAVTRNVSITTTSLANGAMGTPYSTVLAASGGKSPYSWALTSGALPAGLSLDPSSGLISGSPTVTASALPLTFRVTDSSDPALSNIATLELTITPPPLRVTTSSLPSGEVGAAYTATLSATGGSMPYRWSLTQGTLPAGLSFNAAFATIAGTPSAAVAGVALTFTVTDGSGQQQASSVVLTLNIAAAGAAGLDITTTTLPAGRAGAAYSATLAATGGTQPYHWSLTSGALPAGLSLNAASGAISGTPTTGTAVQLSFRVTDSGNPALSNTATLALTIAPATLGIATIALPAGQVGAAYSATLAATGGTTPYTWALTGGTMPPGLALNVTTGVISGAPTASVINRSLTFQVSDTGTPKQAATVTLFVTIAPATLRITTGSLPGGQVGNAYSTTLAATGGTTPYTWSLAGGTLPAGLALAANGVISGTPTASAPATALTIKVVDSGSPAQSSTLTLTLTIVPATLRITTASLPSGQVGASYSATLTAQGGTTPYTWSLAAGSLPAGLTLSASSGAISGTPTASASVLLTFKVTDSGTPAQSNSLTLPLTIAPSGLNITTTSLPVGEVGVAYATTLTASGGTSPYTWSIASGTLPAGLSLNGSGLISGTTTATFSSAITFKVSDSSSPAQSATAVLTLTIASATLTITTGSLPAGQVGLAYSAMLTATGGTTPYTWSLTGGTLPAGLALNASSGAISGTPTARGSASLTFKVTDSGSPARSATVTLPVTIAPAQLAITTGSLPTGQVGQAYSAMLTATGGTTPYAWSVASGSLPAGLSLNVSSGTITGTPPARGSTSLTFKVTDSGSPAQTATATLILTVTPATLTITTGSLPAGEVGQSYSATLAASGGTTPYSWSVASGSLPAGLSLNASSGAITGTPTASASASLTFKVTDSGTPAQSSTVTLLLAIAPATLAITTGSLPNGQVGALYSTTLAAKGGTTPYTWTLTSGTLPAGLSLNGTTGVISGTPTATASGTSLTFQVVDSGNPAQNASVTLTLTITTAKLAIATTSLPGGALGTPYSATLVATGGTLPYTWTLTSGTLPANLSLNAATGAITGTPAATITGTPLTFKVTDSGNPVQSASVSVTLTISSGSITVSVSPARAGLAVTQTLTVSATTNDTAGVTWSISPSGGSFSPTTSQSGANVTFTAPSSAGVYTVTASSVTNTAVSASFTVGVTNLAGVYTYHDDLARDGANVQEYALTTANVTTSTFGKLFSCTVDGAVYAQPLWVANLTIGGSKRNVVFVATAHDGLFAFDADANPCVQLWQVSLIDTNHGANAGETTVPSGATGHLVGSGNGDITPEVGVIGTPVIDPATNTLYVVSKSVSSSQTTFYQRLHAIDITTGNEKSTSSPVTIAATFPGSGDGGSSDTFNPQVQNQRPGLAFVNGTVYIAWASHEDAGYYYGWVVGYTYNAGTFTRSAVLNVTPNVNFGGIWMSGGAPAADNNGRLYLITGNGTFDVTNSTGHTNDYGDSFLQLTSTLGILSYFTPSDQATDAADDADFGSGGSAVVLNLSSGTLSHLVVGGGKDGYLYLLNGDSMGGSGDSNARQRFSLGGGIFATGAFWNSTYYIAAVGNSVSAYEFNSTTDLFSSTSPTSSSPSSFAWPGATPSVSASGSTNGIVWALNTHSYCTPSSCGPAVLHAYDATDLGTELWNSSKVSADAAGYAVKFTVPTVANGKVYVGTRGNNTGGTYGSTTVSGELDVYGLKPN